MNLYLIRHGEILSNVEKRYAGRNDESLTERGRRQAHRIAKKLLPMDVNSLYTSPLKRAIETAEIIGNIIGKEYKIIEEFTEMALGPWEGMSEDEIDREYPIEWNIWQTRPAELNIKGRETLDILLKRVLKGIGEISSVEINNNVVVITHMAIIRVLLLKSQEKSLNLYKSIHVPNCEIFHLSVERKNK